MLLLLSSRTEGLSQVSWLAAFSRCMPLTRGDKENAAKKGAKNSCHIFLHLLHVLLFKHLSFMLPDKRRMFLKGSHEHTEVKVYFCLRFLLRFSVKLLGNMELIWSMLLLNVEIIMCDFYMWLKPVCTVREGRNETDLWKLVQKVPTHLRSLRLRVAVIQAKIQRHTHHDIHKFRV